MKKKILIIEDDLVLQKATKFKLELNGFKVEQAFDGEEGLEMVKKFKPDLIFLDLLLPKKDGWTVLKEIKEDKNLKNIPILIFTVYEGQDSIGQCVALGVKNYFHKSSHSIDDIISEVNRILN